MDVTHVDHLLYVRLELRAEHPEPARIRSTLEALELPLPLGEAPRPGLRARIRTLSGAAVELR